MENIKVGNEVAINALTNELESLKKVTKRQEKEIMEEREKSQDLQEELEIFIQQGWEKGRKLK